MIPVLLSVIAVVSYLIGCLNAVSITSRLVFRRRLRPRTGENAMTTMNRLYGVPGVVAVAVFDAAKTIVVVLLAGLLLHVVGREPVDSIISYTAVGRLFSLFCALLGHCFPVFYRFRGGTGSVVALAGLLCINFPLGVLFGLVFVGIVAATRYVSLGVIAAALLAPLGIWLELGGLCALLSLLCTLILLIRYRKNVVRLIQRTEPKFQLQKDLSMKFEEEDF